MLKACCTVLAFALSSLQTADAAGPQQVAKADFSLWPHPIDSRADFDTASRAELLVAALAFDKALLKLAPADLGVKQIQADSLHRWVEATKKDWLHSFQAASSTCKPQALACGFDGKGWRELTAFASKFAAGQASGAAYAAWLENSQQFYAVYLREQLRLAALFPHPSSEILKLDEAEITGQELPDGQFVLSLDDGPTVAGGGTEHYAQMLADAHISAVFFALGNALERRITSTPALKAIYANHCLGSHGYEHKPHAQWAEWQSSLEKTQNLVHQIFPEAKKILFRPPYGQRQAELIHFVEGQGGKVVLWNIDSQDWNAKIAKSEVSARVKKLMLLKRHGIILFHDVHDKGLVAIPDIVRFAAKAGLFWEDCHAL